MSINEEASHQNDARRRHMGTKAIKIQSGNAPDGEEDVSFDGKLWTVRVKPDAPLVVGTNIFSGTLIVQNKGPDTISINSGYNEEIELQPDQLRMVKIRDKIHFGTVSGASARVRFEFFPSHEK
jgi:hypothetical protein